jgi:hypothetical protein
MQNHFPNEKHFSRINILKLITVVQYKRCQVLVYSQRKGFSYEQIKDIGIENIGQTANFLIATFAFHAT